MPSNVCTVQGQAWDQVSRTSYGTEKLMHRLLSRNADEADVLLFSGNTTLAIPEVTVREARRAVVQAAPWERMAGGR